MGVRRCCECLVIRKVGLEMFVVFARGGGGVQRLLGLICWVAQLVCSCFFSKPILVRESSSALTCRI